MFRRLKAPWRTFLWAAASLWPVCLPAAELQACQGAAVEWIIGGARAVDRVCQSKKLSNQAAPPAGAAVTSNTAQRVRPEQQRLRDDERLRILGLELAFEQAYQATSADRKPDAVARSQANSAALRSEMARIQPASAKGAAAGAASALRY